MPITLDDALIGWPEAQAELEVLRARVAELEACLVEVKRIAFNKKGYKIHDLITDVLSRK